MSESENEDYKEKDIVWAKIKGYLWWPSLISQISFKQQTTLGKTSKEKIYSIELIGEKTNMKVSSEKIEPFIKNFDKHANTKNSSLLKSIELAKKICEKKNKKEKDTEEKNKIDKDNKDNKDTNDNKTTKFLQKKRMNDRIILDDEQNEEEEEKDKTKKDKEEENNNVLSSPNNNIKINININYTLNNQRTYNVNNLNPFKPPEVINQTNTNTITNLSNTKSNTKPNIPKFNSINYSTIQANEKTGNKNNNKKEKNNESNNNSNNKEPTQTKEQEEQSIISLKKEKKTDEKKLELKLGDKPEQKNNEELNEENENSECEEENEELILSNDIINESIQKILNCQIQISNISSQKTISRELINLSEKFNEHFTKNQNDYDNYEIYYLSKDLIPILLNLTYNKNTEIMSKSSEMLSFLNEKIIIEIFNLSKKDQADLLESLNNKNQNEINKETSNDNNDKKDEINLEEEEDFKEGQNLVELINKRGTIRSGISDMHTIYSKRGRPKKISTNSELSSEVFSSKINDGIFTFNNNISEKNYYEEFIKIISSKDKTKIESDFKELCGDFFESVYDKNNADLDMDIAKARKNMCIKLYKILKKVCPEIDSELIKKMIVYFEYKIRNSNAEKIYSCKIKDLFETIKERLLVNDKEK